MLPRRSEPLSCRRVLRSRSSSIVLTFELAKPASPKRFGLYPIRDVPVLCPMNRGGARGRSLNFELQAVLNPAGERKVERLSWTCAPGDKVMQIENDCGR
jgi:exodeoxyribonuclease V alpha subunit